MNSAKKAAAYVIGIKAAADRSSESCLTHLWGNRLRPADCPCGGGCIRAQSKIFCNGCESKLLTATLQGAADGDADVRAAPDDSAALMGMRRYARDLPGPAAGSYPLIPKTCRYPYHTDTQYGGETPSSQAKAAGEMVKEHCEGRLVC